MRIICHPSRLALCPALFFCFGAITTTACAETPAEYRNACQHELTAPYSDSFRYIIQLENGKQTAQGDATTFSSIALVALAAELYHSAPPESGKSINQMLSTLLNALHETGWSHHHGKLYPIRHPDDYDYEPAKGLPKKVRRSPLSRDSFGSIICGAYYAYHAPHCSRENKTLAKKLVEKWIHFLLESGWKLDPEPNFNLKLKPMYCNQDGKMKQAGPETYILAPHERYTLRSVAASMGIVTADWDIWAGVDASLTQLVAEIVAGNLFDQIRYAADQCHFNIPVKVRVPWLGLDYETSVEVEMPLPPEDNTRQFLKEVVSKYFAARGAMSQTGTLNSMVVDHMLDGLPQEWFGFRWKEFLSYTLERMVPWLTWDSVDELAAFSIASVVAARAEGDPSDFINAYMVWSFAAFMECRPEMAVALSPLVRAHYARLQSKGNANGIWSWLSGDVSQVQSYIVLFENSPRRKWNDYAWHRNASQFFSDDIHNKYMSQSKSFSRIDYLVLEALQSKGVPQFREIQFDSVIEHFRDQWDKIASRMVEQIAKDTDNGKVVVRTLIAHGQHIYERWTKEGIEKIQIAHDGLAKVEQWIPNMPVGMFDLKIGDISDAELAKVMADSYLTINQSLDARAKKLIEAKKAADESARKLADQLHAKAVALHAEAVAKELDEL